MADVAVVEVLVCPLLQVVWSDVGAIRELSRSELGEVSPACEHRPGFVLSGDWVMEVCFTRFQFACPWLKLADGAGQRSGEYRGRGRYRL